MLDKSLSAAPGTDDTPAMAIAEAENERRWIIAEGGDVTDIEARITALRAVAPTAPDTTSATAAQVWAHLGNAPQAHNLPAPTQISVHEHPHEYRAALIYLQHHTLTDLYTWVAWLGAGDLTSRVYDAPEPGHVMRATETGVTWRGWNIEITLLQAVPVETLTIAFGQDAGVR